MNEALKLAKRAELENEVPVGAIIIFQEKIIAQGYNQRESKKDAFAHAEIIALKQASQFLGQWRLCECILVVTLEPCLMCLAACQQARIKKIIYGAVDLKGGALSLGYSFFQDQRLAHQFEVIHEPSIPCGKILTEFFQKKRRTQKNN